MKVDKAVCTNDNTLEDLTKAIKYEAVFTTLVENKILAIKRDCEEKKKAKRHKRRTFGRMLFGRKIFGGSSGTSSSNSPKKSTENYVSFDIEKEGGQSTSEILKKSNPLEVESLISSVHDETIRTKNIHDKDDDMQNVVVESKNVHDDKIEIIASEIDDRHIVSEIRSTYIPDVLQQDDSNGSNGSPTERGGARDVIVEVLTHREDHSYDDIEKYDLTDVKLNLNVLKLITDNTADISSLGSNRIEENTSTSIADETLTSIKDSSESLSFPSSRCTISAALGTSLSYEKERNRLRVLEAKSISAQCSPILSRQKPPFNIAQKYNNIQTQTQSPLINDKEHVKKNQQLQSQVSYNIEDDHVHNCNEHALNIFSRQNTSEDSANLTISTLLNEADSTAMYNLYGERKKSKSTSVLVVTDTDNQKAIKRLDSNSIVNYQTNPLARGFITSYNQLATSSTNHFPPVETSKQEPTQPALVLSSIIPISSCDTAKLQRMTSTSTGSSVAPGCCATAKSREKDKRSKPGWENGQSGSDDEYRKRKRRYKRYHRCSDPVLVYPSSGGLQHCILSMPPNLPIQFHYNDDFVYDMTLQVEADQNGDLQAIVPSHRNNRHRHHRHKKRHRHKKPKILVHDLDTQSVKVIDPDDLPQRARWTIIATACLLLIMCLMLVGITLRMAPIIDDMVRQENERLMQESMNRARFAKNFTEAASLSANNENEIP